MTTLAVGDTGIRLVTDHGAGTYPAWQAGSKLTLSKSVGGRTFTMLSGIPPSEAASPAINCPQISSFVSDDGAGTVVQWCHSTSAGVGWGTEVYILNNTAENNRHDLNAVESGKLGDTPPLDARTKALAQGLSDASGENGVRIYNPCFWLSPGQETTPGFPALNKREVSGWTTRVDYTWGLAGNNNIIQMLLTMIIPTDAIIQSKTQLSMVPFFHYSPNYNVNSINSAFVNKPFTTQEWVALADGATRAYVGPASTDVSTTEVLMNYTTDETCAVAVVYGDGALGSAGAAPTGYRGLNGGPPNFVNSYGFCVKTYAGGVPAGTITIPMALCFGTRAELIGASGAIAVAAANLAAASYPT